MQSNYINDRTTLHNATTDTALTGVVDSLAGAIGCYIMIRHTKAHALTLLLYALCVISSNVIDATRCCSYFVTVLLSRMGTVPCTCCDTSGLIVIAPYLFRFS